MLKPGELAAAFATYWDDMERSRGAAAYWSLLHVTVCLPDICATLQAPTGETTGARYVAWCDEYLKDPILTGAERYRMRCKVLHQGRSTTDEPGRYTGFAFGQPSSSGEVDHKRVDAGVLHLDVRELANEMRLAVDSWISKLEASSGEPEAQNVAQNLAMLVRVSVSVVVKVPTAWTAVGPGGAVSSTSFGTGSVVTTTIHKTN